MRLRIEYLPTYDMSWGGLSKAHPSDAGFDVRAVDNVTILPHSGVKVNLGFKTEFEEGYEAQLRARSGLASKYGIGLVNGIGTIDANYRGEWAVLLYNHSNEIICLQRGERVAQVVFNQLPQVDIEYGEVNTSDRGAGGFGSTGNE